MRSVNSNGLVDQGDLDLVLLNWGRELTDPAGGGWYNDLPSGVIDQEELDKVLLGWGNSVALSRAAAVPEPSAFLLLAIAITVIAARRQRGIQRGNPGRFLKRLSRDRAMSASMTCAG